MSDVSPPPPPEPPPGGYPPPPPGGYPPPPPGGYPPPPPGGYPPQPPGGYPPPPPEPPPGGYPPPPGWGPQGYGAPPANPAWQGPPLADYGRRLGAGAIDYLLPSVVANAFRFASFGLYAVVALAALGFTVYSKVLEGQTGQSIGKQVVGARTVVEATGQPPGVGLAIGRWLLHILDALPCLLGYLWPAWDTKRQTFADKIVRTVVVLA